MGIQLIVYHNLMELDTNDAHPSTELDSIEMVRRDHQYGDGNTQQSNHSE